MALPQFSLVQMSPRETEFVSCSARVHFHAFAFSHEGSEVVVVVSCFEELHQAK